MIRNGSLRNKRKRYTARRGTAVVEFAVIAPIFLLLVFGIIEFGRLVNVQSVVTNAAREGARVGVLDGTTNDEIENRIDAYLSGSGVSGQTVTVTTLPPDGSDSAERVSVSVSIPFDQVSWIPTPMFIKNYTLSSTTVMRRESMD